MNNSIEFIKERIQQKCCDYWVPVNGWDEAIIIHPFDILQIDKNNNRIVNTCFELEKHKIHITVIYNPDENFDYVSFNSCWNDGTLCFVQEILYNTAMKPFQLGTYNKLAAPKNFNPNSIESISSYSYEYVVGDCVLLNEIKESPIQEKPWMQQHTVVGLPIKMKFVKNNI